MTDSCNKHEERYFYDIKLWVWFQITGNTGWGRGANVGEEELYPGNAFSPLCLLYKACKNKWGKNVKTGRRLCSAFQGGGGGGRRRGGRTWLSNISSRKYAEKVTGLVGSTGFSLYENQKEGGGKEGFVRLLSLLLLGRGGWQMKCGRYGGSGKKNKRYTPPPPSPLCLQCSPKLKRYVRTAMKALEEKKKTKKGGGGGSTEQSFFTWERGQQALFFFFFFKSNSH